MFKLLDESSPSPAKPSTLNKAMSVDVDIPIPLSADELQADALNFQLIADQLPATDWDQALALYLSKGDYKKAAILLKLPLFNACRYGRDCIFLERNANEK